MINYSKIKDICEITNGYAFKSDKYVTDEGVRVSSSQIIKAVSTVFKQINLNIDKKISFSTAKKYIKMVYKMNDISVRIGDKVETQYNLEKYKPFSELKKNRKTKSPTNSKISTVGL